VTELPTYDELPRNEDGIPSAWGLFGADDDLGMANLLTAERARVAAGLVRSGEVFPLDASIDHFQPPLFERTGPRQELIVSSNDWAITDVIDDFNPQASSQWDALGHHGYAVDTFYNGVTIADVVERGRLTIGHLARHGVAARGVLLDLERMMREAGREYSPGTDHAFAPADLEAARELAGVEIRSGDTLILRTGFISWYGGLDGAERQRIAARSELRTAGIAHTEEMARHLWDLHPWAVAADNPALEVWPLDGAAASHPYGILHHVLLGQLGIHIGELWWLEDLAAACAADGRYEFMLTSAPLHTRGTGSTANALAIR
jgi:hypothetical protein